MAAVRANQRISGRASEITNRRPALLVDGHIFIQMCIRGRHQIDINLFLLQALTQGRDALGDPFIGHRYGIQEALSFDNQYERIIDG